MRLRPHSYYIDQGNKSNGFAKRNFRKLFTFTCYLKGFYIGWMMLNLVVEWDYYSPIWFKRLAIAAPVHVYVRRADSYRKE